MKILIFFFISFIKIILSEICTYSISCDNQEDESNNICATKKRTESNTIFEIKVKKCPSMTCNIYNTLLGDTEKNTTCENPQDNGLIQNPSYPGGICKSDLNCLSGICISGKCVDSSIYENCHSHENCPLNTACINGICRNYLRPNEQCEDSFQCEFDSFCNKETKKCQKLFSFEDGADITNLTSENERIENLCKSGGYITEKNSEGKLIKKCETLTNLNNSCNDICSYNKKSNNEIFISEEKCMCGYNKYRSKFCVLGNGEKLYKEHLENKKKFIRNKTYTQYCHTLERDFDEICLELLNTDFSVPFRKYVKEYNNKKILALQHHRLQESEECIKEVVFNYNTKDIFNLKQTCPKFSCNPSQQNCLYGLNPLNDEGNGITISLNPDSCREKEYCSLQNEKKINTIINASLIMENPKLEGQCKVFRENIYIKRYPGEDCIFDSDCLLEESSCINGKCSGVGLNGNCTNTSQCIVGYYCNKDLGLCDKQKGDGQTCKEAWDCQNYLGCYRGRCIKFGVLKKGIKITKEYAPFPGDDRRNYLCATGELEGEDGLSGNYCVENDYNDTWVKNEGKEIEEGGFIKCNYGEKCLYFNGKNSFEKNCECGYNEEGQGYCPLPSGRKVKAWKERMQFLGNSAKNGCHSLSRFNCYLKNNYEFFAEKRKQEFNTLKAHLFHNPIDCAYKIFAKQNFIRYNFYFIGLFLLMLY